jgi:predicted RNA-binding protein with RPS1 domain
MAENEYDSPTLWDIINEKYKIIIPTYFQNLTKYTGFDNITAFSDITNDDLNYIENFARTKLLKIIDKYKVKLEDFYHVHYKNIELFEIAVGHKKLILTVGRLLMADKMSQLCSSESLPKPSPKVKKQKLDYSEEGLVILNMINKWFLKNFQEKLDIVASVDIRKSNSEDPVAFVICSHCDTSIKISYQNYKTKSGLRPRWVTTNFNKHFKEKHANLSSSLNDGQRFLKKTKSQNIEEMFDKQSELNSKKLQPFSEIDLSIENNDADLVSCFHNNKRRF